MWGAHLWRDLSLRKLAVANRGGSWAKKKLQNRPQLSTKYYSIHSEKQIWLGGRELGLTQTEISAVNLRVEMPVENTRPRQLKALNVLL